MFSGWYSICLASLACQCYGKEYDYVVVGSGPGGGTVAVELARAGFSTLLIEAGPDHGSEINSMPIMHFKASEDPNTVLDFNVHHYDENDGGYFYPRAAALGGCSVHNAMIALYPNSRDFVRLRRLTGDPAWDEENMRKYLLSIEANQYVPRTPENERIHGYDGWLPISHIDMSRFVKVGSAMLDIVEKVVGDDRKDANGYFRTKLSTDTTGRIFIPLALDKRTFRRFNLGEHIKTQARKTSSLDIWTDTFATKIIIDDNMQARGIEYSRGAYLYRASPRSSDARRSAAKKGKVIARREVIVAGGSFNTPQLLMLSGIGNRTELEKLKIKVLNDLPGVGMNMMDRYEIPHTVKYPQNFRLLQGCRYETKDGDACYEEYTKNLTGAYTSNGGVSAELIKTRPGLTEPDLLMLNILADFHGYYRNYSNEIQNERGSFTRLANLGHTMNNGHVKLRSTDPFMTPEINFRYFSQDPENLDKLVQIVKDQRKYFESFPGTFTEIYPGPAIQTDDQIKAFVKKIAWGHHACCTAKLGKDDDPLAVLDSGFRVRGIKNLRVVDSSSLPSLPGYFPSLFLHMMASRVADLIIQDASR